jgi:ATP-binding cassette subfamily C protein
MGNFIDHLVGAIDISFIYNYFLLFVSISLSTLILGFISGRLYARLQAQAGYEMNKDMIQRLQKAPLAATQGQDTAYLNQRINNDSNGLIIFCIGIIQNILVNLFMIIAPLFLLFQFNVKLTLVLIGIIVIYFVGYILYKKRLYTVSLDFKEAQAGFFAKLNEQLFNIKFIKIHGLFTSFFSRLEKRFTVLLSSSLRYQKTNYVFSGLDRIISMLAQILVLFLGGIEVVHGRLSIGEFVIMSSYFNMLLSSVRYFFTLGQGIQDNLVSYNRLKEIQTIEEEANGDNMLTSIRDIEVQNSSFHHGENEIFRNINARFIRGKTYAILGPNGSGKSTFIEVLLGLYIGKHTGNVLYNGISIEKINMYSLRERLIGVSEQEPMLLPDSLVYNLTFGQTERYDNSKANEIVNILGLKKYINALPDGLSTVINEKASNLSGGEKQKISLLRTLLSEPDLIILDEPTSALDSSSRDQLKAYLDRIKNEKIIIIITHDKDFADGCDNIIQLTSLAGSAT